MKYIKWNETNGTPSCEPSIENPFEIKAKWFLWKAAVSETADPVGATGDKAAVAT